MMTRIILLLIVSTLVSCQTSYRAKSMLDGLGYQDKKVTDDVYQILYKVNKVTPKQKVLDFWHVRATELCGHENYFADVGLSKRRLKPEPRPRAISPPNHYYATTTLSGHEVWKRDYASKSYPQHFADANLFPRISGIAYCAGKPEKLLALEPQSKAY